MASACNLSRRTVSITEAPSLATLYPTFSPLEIQLWASRGALETPQSLNTWLKAPLRDLRQGASRVLRAITKKEQIVVVADYDCDGATACAVMVTGLQALGACVSFVVPDRLVHGYGISASVVDLAVERFPKAQVLITVDNGILGHAGIAHAQQLGLEVIVTDHHLPGDSLPDALAVINPSRKDEPGTLVQLAGCAVALWLVSEVKRLMAEQGQNTPSLSFLLPYVALGTVADMVPMGVVNRNFVSQGLEFMRQGKAPVGVLALIAEAGAAGHLLTTQDIGFGIAPRINAAGRLDTMDLGINLLLEQSPHKAAQMARMLSDTNAQRKKIQREATEQATLSVDMEIQPDTRSIVRAHSDWHPGIVGLVASRLKDAHNLPTFVFAMEGGMVKGSGRSIPGFHLKDALEEIARRRPGLLLKFGGHAMAAGATLSGEAAVPVFEQELEDIAQERITLTMLQKKLLSDGPVPKLDLAEAKRILRHPWGQGFEPPAFDDEAQVLAVSPLGKDGLHWKIQAKFSSLDDAIPVVLFNHAQPQEGRRIQLFLQPSLNTWREQTSIQWLGKVLD